MPPDIDIYVQSQRRDRDTIERFVREFALPEDASAREREEIMMLPLNAQVEPSESDGYEWSPALSVQHMIQWGLSQPYRAFRMYMNAFSAVHSQAVVAFRADPTVVFGLSLDEGRGDRLEEAKQVLEHLKVSYGGIAGFIGWDVPAPLLGASFPPPELDRVILSWPSVSA